ncbi:Uma2 family endonuclease [Prosthecodimorpha staleyi]|uniref:Uma2 family endonuclease n=1 Tax=Prosthecodimorpha staleyi TaxID=2840188 RepID=A0A947D7T6_9HYPH|nr:Uma2 family endonuclease [Prosthecodimorpha staleyi]MBT9288419.1 Uma2 family endonuclease [Prosthecodimorpha staleyi]
MSVTAEQHDETMRADDFIAWAAGRFEDTRYELLDGMPVAMAGGTSLHETIAGNIFGELFQKLRGSPCRAYRDLLLRSPVNDRFAVYPDVYVRCGPPLSDEALSVDDASIVIEILSPSTMHLDRGYKLQEYRRMPSIRQYLIVHSRELRIENWQRATEEPWPAEPEILAGRAGLVTLPSLGLSLALADLYAGTGTATL